MSNIKELFQFYSGDYTYKKTIVTYIIANIVILSIAILDYIIRDYFISHIILGVIFIIFIYLLLAFIARMITISDNRNINKTINGKNKFKYNPINIELEDIVLWISKFDEPELLVCSIENEFFVIEISYDIKGRRGEYYNRQLYFNNKVIDESSLIEKLKNKAINNIVKVYQTFDTNKPELIFDEINKIKNNI